MSDYHYRSYGCSYRFFQNLFICLSLNEKVGRQLQEQDTQFEQIVWWRESEKEYNQIDGSIRGKIDQLKQAHKEHNCSVLT